MQYVYILRSIADNNLYVGCTKNLKNRLLLHNHKKVPSTADRTPLILIYYEAYLDAHDAFVRETFLKTGWGKNYIKKVLHNYFISKKLGG